jgi:endonuclease YncB( thermonuclease family)
MDRLHSLSKLTGVALLAVIAGMASDAARADSPPVPPAMPATPVETAPLAPPPPQEFEGRAVALDGMTLQLGEERLILFGIAVPGMAAPGGIKARLALDDLLAGDGRLHCVVAARDLQLHKFAVCRLGDIDLGEALLLAGVGTVDRYMTRAKDAEPQLADRYDQAEAEARRAGNGLWAEFVKPPEAEKPPEPTILQRLCHFLKEWQAGIGALVGFLLVGVLLFVTRRCAPAK